MGQPVQFNEKDDQINLLIGERKLSLHKGDILTLSADAIVCPTNADLDFKSGFAQIIARAAGRSINKERPLSPEPFGKVVVFPGGNLKVKYIFLTVLYGERGIEKIRLSIRQSVERAIRYAEFLRLKSIAFPVMGDPHAQPSYDFVAHEMVQQAVQYFRRRNTKLKAILFSAYNEKAFEAMKKEARHISI